MAITFSANMATIPKDGSTVALFWCTHSTATGAITGRFVRMMKWDVSTQTFIEDIPSPRDVAGPYLGWAATGALPF